MPSLRILYDVEGWAYHHRARALLKYSPDDFNVTLGSFNIDGARPASRAQVFKALGERPVDVVFSLNYHDIEFVRDCLDELGWSSKLVASWNCGWPREQHHFHRVFAVADRVIVNNEEYWEQMGCLPQTSHCSNGVDTDIFRVRIPLEDRPQRVLWVGSELQRQNKGYDDYIKPLFEILRGRGLDCEALLVDSYGSSKCSREQMADWYNQGTILVCASESEGTPNPALEAAACGCTIVTTRVGNMPELIVDGSNGIFVEHELDSFLTGVERAQSESLALRQRMQDSMSAWSWSIRKKAIFNALELALSQDACDAAPSKRRRADLSNELTVFVTSIGSPLFEKCIHSIRGQDCTFVLRVIQGVAPLSAAFQAMLDKCTTPFFIQVDEDMELEPHSVQNLYREITRGDANVAIYKANLWDTHLARCIHGVKIFRHEIVRRYPYDDVESCDKDQVDRLFNDGFDIKSVPVDGEDHDCTQVLGSHTPTGSDLSVYERYMTLEVKRRRRPVAMGWFAPYQDIFEERFIKDPSRVNLFALMGVMAGSLVSLSELNGEKDYRKYNQLPGFSALCQLLNQVESVELSTASLREHATALVQNAIHKQAGA